MKRALISAALIGLAAAPAFAADIPMQAPVAAPVVAPAMSWSGFYMGLDGGGTWGKAQVTHSAVVPAPVFAFPIDAAALTAATSTDMKLNGWTFGGHLGYNWQFATNWLVGLEADFSYFRLRGSSGGTFPFPSTLPGGILGPPTLTFTTETSFSTDWLFTFRPRLGVVLGDSLLAYATGGLAVTNEKVDQTAAGVMGTFNAAVNETRIGWVVGGGLEYALGRNWSIRAEYLHLDFGTASGPGNIVVPTGVLGNALCVAGQGIVTGPATITGCSIASRLTADVVRGGITYRFGGPDTVVARY
ncbi:MAG: outer membrane beta-barrel protein [Xanthobacteraceae bacterium]